MQTNLNHGSFTYNYNYRYLAKDFFSNSGFKQKVGIYLERENFIIRTASNTEDVKKAIELRSKVFLEELNNNNGISTVDIDEFDILSDHLLLIERETDTVIGTYRFNSNLFSNHFYSETEFNIFTILTMPGIKVELGRACIHKDYRGGMTLSLLWTGLLAYIQKINADFLFGCSSFHIPDKLNAAMLYKFLMEKHDSGSGVKVYPRKKYRIEDFDLFLLQVENSVKKEYLLSQRFIPGLVKGYISAGAKICGEPVYDPDFNCYDFFTLLDLKMLNRDYVKMVTL